MPIATNHNLNAANDQRDHIYATFATTLKNGGTN